MPLVKKPKCDVKRRNFKSPESFSEVLFLTLGR